MYTQNDAEVLPNHEDVVAEEHEELEAEEEAQPAKILRTLTLPSPADIDAVHSRGVSARQRAGAAGGQARPARRPARRVEPR